jgi:multidrug resistance efflux pump
MKVVFKHEKQINPQAEGGLKVNYAGAKRAAFKLRWNLLLLLILSPIIIFFIYLFNEEVLINADGILTSEPITIYAREDGLIEKIYYLPGEKIPAGQDLFVMSSPIIDAEVTFLTEKLDYYREKQSASLAKLTLLYHKKVELYNNAVKGNADLSKEYKKNNYENYISLTDKVTYHIARIKIDGEQIGSEIDYKLALEKHDTGSLAKIILDLELRLVLARSKQKLQNVRLDASGTINEIFVHAGNYVKKGDLIMNISNLKQPVVHVYLQPKYLEYAKIGSKVTVTFPDGKKHQGSIKVPVKIADKIPSILSGPFATNKAAIKMQIDFDEPIVQFIEGIPVKVRYHFQDVF